MKYKIQIILENYPGIGCVTSEIKPSRTNPHFLFVKSPFGNCQSFSINNIKGALDIPVEDFRGILSDIYKDFGRRVLVIDVNECYSAKIMKMFDGFIKNVVSTPYESSNGSRMIMHIITLNNEALIKYKK